MATRTGCPLYIDCGFVKWRKERPYGHMTPLPADGDCGKLVEDCGRLNPRVPREVGAYGLAFDGEMKLALPEIPNKNKRRPHRIVGGGHR